MSLSRLSYRCHDVHWHGHVSIMSCTDCDLPVVYSDANEVVGPPVSICFVLGLPMETGPIESQSIQSLFAMLLLIVMELQRRMASSESAASSHANEPAMTTMRSQGSFTSSTCSYSGAENPHAAPYGPAPAMAAGYARPHGPCPHACAFCQNPCSRPASTKTQTSQKPAV